MGINDVPITYYDRPNYVGVRIVHHYPDVPIGVCNLVESVIPIVSQGGLVSSSRNRRIVCSVCIRIGRIYEFHDVHVVIVVVGERARRRSAPARTVKCRGVTRRVLPRRGSSRDALRHLKEKFPFVEYPGFSIPLGVYHQHPILIPVIAMSNIERIRAIDLQPGLNHVIDAIKESQPVRKRIAT